MNRRIRKDGYATIRHEGKELLEHRYIAKKFIPNPENKPCVNHKDGNRSNNNLDNLEWVTYSENHKHAYRVLGRKVNNHNAAKGETHPLSKLTQKDVEYIKNSSNSGIELSKIYNVSTALISGIKTNKRWK
jgi:hypothetical protein